MSEQEKHRPSLEWRTAAGQPAGSSGITHLPGSRDHRHPPGPPRVARGGATPTRSSTYLVVTYLPSARLYLPTKTRQSQFVYSRHNKLSCSPHSYMWGGKLGGYNLTNRDATAENILQWTHEEVGRIRGRKTLEAGRSREHCRGGGSGGRLRVRNNFSTKWLENLLLIPFWFCGSKGLPMPVRDADDASITKGFTRLMKSPEDYSSYSSSLVRCLSWSSHKWGI